MEARTHCPNCGSEVEPLAFCGVCGKPLPQPGREIDRSPRGRLVAALSAARARPVTSLLVVALSVVFLLLLGDRAGFATLVALLIGPALLIHYLTRLDLYEREPWPLMAGVVAAGGVLGLLGGWLASVIFDRFWFTDPDLNLGAVGFAGIAANGRDGVPFGVLLLNGFLIPVLVGAAIVGGPVLLRRWPAFRNEVMDGMTLGGLAASGFATVTAFVYLWPSVFDDLPDRPVSQWTALLAGTVVIRPVVLIVAGSLLGITAWQYLRTKDVRAVIVAGIGGVFGWLALPLGSLVLAQSGAVAEFIWYAVVLVVVGVLFREALSRGLARDAEALAPADGQQRVVCPTCHRVTPDGSFCSFCRSPLHEPAPAALATARQPVAGRTEEQPANGETGTATPDPEADIADHPDQNAPVFAPTMARRESTPTDDDPSAGDEDGSGGPSELRSAWPAGVGLGAASSTSDIGQYSPSVPAAGDVTQENDDDAERTHDVRDALGLEVDAVDEQFAADDYRWDDAEEAHADDWSDSATGRYAGDEDPVISPVTTRAVSGDVWQDLDELAFPEVGTNESTPEPDTDLASEPVGQGAEPLSSIITDTPGTDGTAPPRTGAFADKASEAFLDDREDASRDPAPGAATVMEPSGFPPARSGAEPFAGQTQRQVTSSSGRWFEASSGRPGESRSDPATGSNASPDPAPDRSREPIPLFPPASPVGLDRDDAGLDGQIEAGTGATPGRPTPPGLRWYRSEEERPATTTGSPPGESGGQPPETPAGERPASAPNAPASNVAAPVEPAAENGPGTGRQGLWRQLTRGVRTSGPRAPQRDNDRQTGGSTEGQGPGRSEP